MTDICQVCLKTDMVILCDHCYNSIHIKCNNLDKFDYEMLKSTADLWFFITCTSNILTFWNGHEKAKETITTPANLFCHNELFHLIKNLKNLTDESSNDDANSLNVSNNIEIQNTSFSPTNIALANYVIEQTPTGSNVGGALLYINRKHSYKIRKDLKLYIQAL